MSIWATWAMYPRFSLRLEIESDRDKISLDCFPNLRTINMYLMLFMKGEIVSQVRCGPCRSHLARRVAGAWSSSIFISKRTRRQGEQPLYIFIWILTGSTALSCHRINSDDLTAARITERAAASVSPRILLQSGCMPGRETAVLDCLMRRRP